VGLKSLERNKKTYNFTMNTTLRSAFIYFSQSIRYNFC